MVSVACRLIGMLGLIGLCGLFAGCDAELYHDLSERRANEALLALREAGLRADKHEQRSANSRGPSFTLVVPRSEESRALVVLGQRGLPRLPEKPSPSASKLLVSPAEQRSENTAALSASLADTLERLPEVAEARVHLALPDADPLSPTGSLRPTASVLLRLRAPLPVKPSDVAELIARSVPGLDAQDVAVVRAPFPADHAADKLPPLVAVGPLLVAPESRPLTLFFAGLMILLVVGSGVFLRLAWTRRPARSRQG